MKKLRFHKTFIMLTMMVGIALMIASCGRTYVHGDYGYRRPYYNYSSPRPYRYGPQVVIVPRYCPPSRRGYHGGGYGRGRRW